MIWSDLRRLGWIVFLALGGALAANAQESSIYVQCPPNTVLHPFGDGIVCRHLVAGDGMVTMADDAGKELYIFSFSDLPGGGPPPNTP
jgi:hypothetical protein